MNKTKILLSGWLDLGPIGRHGLSFIKTLQQDDRNEIWLDSDYVSKQDAQKLLNNIKNIKFTNNKTNPEFDFLIYFHVLSINPFDKWFEKSLTKKSKIKICYPVFDGTVPPLEWIKQINDNFDICCSPSQYVAHNLKRHGVTIDCFGLECCVLIENIMQIKRKPTDKFRFGCISGYEARKNLKFLVESFAQTFSKDEPVELFIHSVKRDNLMTPFNEFADTVKQANKTSNVILHTDFVSQPEMDDIWASFDAYIIPQKNTGYYTTPLESMAAGLPVILSDIPVHREFTQYIKEKDNLFFAAHPIYTPEFHFVFDYRNLGVSFDSTTEIYKKLFRKVYENRNKLYSDDLINARKQAARAFLPENLSIRHNTLIHPKTIAICKSTSHLADNGVFYMSKDLAAKYEKFGFGKIEKITDNYIEPKYPEEQDPMFQALEKTAITSQTIWLKRHMTTSSMLLNSKYLQKLLNKSEKFNVTVLPRFIYEMFSIYCKIKWLFRKFYKNGVKK